MPKSLTPKGRKAAGPARTDKVGQSAAPKKRKASKKAPAKEATSTAAPTVWIRNLHYGAGGARFDLLTYDKRIELAPRGHIGDLLQTTEEMREDPRYQRNKDILFEEVSREIAMQILDKQNINAQTYRGPTPMDFIRNEKGEKYSQVRAVVEPSFESQGIVVGQVSTAADGKGAREVGNITDRASGAPPQQTYPPGSYELAPQDFDPNVMPAGLSMQQAGLYAETPPEQRFALLQRFLSEGAHGVGLNVVVTAPESVDE
jgi:hypothetical protein